MVVDSHIHVGQFYDIYTSPSQLLHFLDKVGVERFAVSSTTICEANYTKVLRELNQLYQSAGNRVLPILWIIPPMFEDGGLSFFLNSSLPWKCLKIHPQLHCDSWNPNGKNIKKLMELATLLQLPVLIHTGDFDYCHAGLYKQLAQKNPNINFILAHGRPIEETIEMMQTCSNVYTDTAFMPTHHIVRLCAAKLEDRILWGTDYPIPRYFMRGKNMVRYYNKSVAALCTQVEESMAEKILRQNLSTIMPL